jgi:hypothetical protein
MPRRIRVAVGCSASAGTSAKRSKVMALGALINAGSLSEGDASLPINRRDSRPAMTGGD